ncbi:tetratricopeptide repeat protein [Calothrix membranacea FACHB-236]|nr:tetratricopeptide repeat protein [Calothrix membranacea FACHB-236]
MFITERANAQRTAVPLDYPPPAAVYNCAGYNPVFPTVAPSSILGEIELDGNGTYSSKSYGEGEYLFEPETSRVRFISGQLSSWVGVWEIRGGDVRIRFPQTPDTPIKPDTSVNDTVCYPEKAKRRAGLTRRQIQKLADRVRKMSGSDAARNLPNNVDLIYAPGYAFRGALKRRLKDFRGAIADTNQAIKLNREYPASYVTRGVSRARLKDFQGALSDLNQAIKLEPKSASTYYYRGLVRHLQGDKQEAISDYERAVQISPELVKHLEQETFDNYILAARR